jgi:hypothetical protein
MNAKSASLVVLGLFLGLIASALFGEHQSAAAADPPLASQTPRYQVSAYAGPHGNGFGHGCYIIDTTTGEVWQTGQGGQLSKVLKPLAK